MGGRGSSYNRSILPPTPVLAQVIDDDDDQDDQQQAQMLNATLQKGTANTPSGYTLDDFKKMDDQTAASLIEWANDTMTLSKDFHNDPTQRLIHALGIDKPMENIGGRALQRYVDAGATVLYRGLDESTVNGVYRSADQIADSIREGSQFSTGGWGGQAHGGGMYMTDRYDGTKYYGTEHVIGAVFNSKANHIDGGSLMLKADSWLKSRPAFRRTLAKIAGVSPSASTYTLLTKVGSASESYRTRSIVALAIGYTSLSDKVVGNENYYVILDRSTLSTSRYNHRKSMKKSGT